jgi:5-methyltetrahydrofolate--homocysteine methyltransferase
VTPPRPPAPTPARPSSLLAGPGPRLLDGALGSQLLGSGFDLRRDFLGRERCCEALNLTRPEQVQAVHESYLDAGSDLVCTNTFLATASALRARQLSERQGELVRRAVGAARAAAEAWGDEERPRRVLGCLGPGLDRPTESGRSAAEIEREYGELAALLDAAGVDGLLLETCADPRLLCSAAAGIRARSALPLWISFAPWKERLVGGFELREAVAAVRDCGPELLALNCGAGFEHDEPQLAALRELWTGPLGYWPAAPAAGPEARPAGFAAALAERARRFGLALVGGCCGTTPAHLRALAAAVGRPAPGDGWYDEPTGDGAAVLEAHGEEHGEEDGEEDGQEVDEREPAGP